MANDELGRIKCECGATASVFQAKRKGAHLYTRCPSCGLDQRTGAAVQSRLYWLTDWNGGIKPTKPQGVGDAPTEAQPKKPTDKQPKAVADFDPSTETESVKATEKPTESEPKGNLKAVVGLIVIFAGLGGVLWKM